MFKEKKKVLAVVDDLLFTVKINDAARRAGLDAQFIKSEKDLLDKAESALGDARIAGRRGDQEALLDTKPDLEAIDRQLRDFSDAHR